MKIEKVNDHQIRCTLTKADLADRELKISELAYGTEKAKSLFRDMMQQAAIKFGFEAEDIPLMIEAIPLNSDCIVLIITKVEDPEELDTRFSKFAPSVHDDDSLDDMIQDLNEGADDVLDLFRRIHEDAPLPREPERRPHRSLLPRRRKRRICRSPAFIPSTPSTISPGSPMFWKASITESIPFTRTREMDVISCSSQLLTHAEEFNRLCNCLSEYGRQEKAAPGGEAFLEEHCELIVKDHALQAFGRI